MNTTDFMGCVHLTKLKLIYSIPSLNKEHKKYKKWKKKKLLTILFFISAFSYSRNGKLNMYTRKYAYTNLGH